MARRLNNWLSAYLTRVENTEPATRFHLWAAITMIGALVGRKCFLRVGPETIYPNLYTVLVGPSGVKKGTAIRYAHDLLSALGPEAVVMSPDATSPQQLYNVLERSQRQIVVDGKPTVHSSLFVIAYELSVFLPDTDPKRMADLCDLYDCRPTFSYETRTSGSNYIVNPCLSILGATAPSWIEDNLRMLAVGGGMTARILFIYADHKERHCPLTRMEDFDQKLTAQLIDDLADIAETCGEFSITEEAGKLFTDWYGWDDTSPYCQSRPMDERLHGFWNRVPVMVLKVAMILSLAESSSRVVEARHVSSAIKLILRVLPDMPKAFGSLGRNILGAQTAMVRKLVQQMGRAPKSTIMRALSMHLSEPDYQKVKMALIAEKSVIREWDQELKEEVLVSYELAQSLEGMKPAED